MTGKQQQGGHGNDGDHAGDGNDNRPTIRRKRKRQQRRTWTETRMGQERHTRSRHKQETWAVGKVFFSFLISFATRFSLGTDLYTTTTTTGVPRPTLNTAMRTCRGAAGWLQYHMDHYCNYLWSTSNRDRFSANLDINTVIADLGYPPPNIENVRTRFNIKEHFWSCEALTLTLLWIKISHESKDSKT